MSENNISGDFMTKKRVKEIIIIVSVVLAVVLIIAAAFISDNSLKKENESTDISTTEPVSNSESSTKEESAAIPWNLVLVNPDTPLPENYEINVKQLDNGQAVDERCYDALQNMMNDCRRAGLRPVICSSYRTQEKQQMLFDNQVEKWKNQGYSVDEAKMQAGKLVAVPGTSEHQLGLALDIVDISYQLLEEKQENTPTQKWLLENSWKYGFILRYPKDKTDITKISYEPWHYRYVGEKAAKEIFDAKICLEEYLKK